MSIFWPPCRFFAASCFSPPFTSRRLLSLHTSPHLCLSCWAFRSIRPCLRRRHRPARPLHRLISQCKLVLALRSFSRTLHRWCRDCSAHECCLLLDRWWKLVLLLPPLHAQNYIYLS